MPFWVKFIFLLVQVLSIVLAIWVDSDVRNQIRCQIQYTHCSNQKDFNSKMLTVIRIVYLIIILIFPWVFYIFLTRP